MNAPPWPANPNIGDWWQNWVWNGARWVTSPTTGLRVVTQTFTQSGPYMPSPGLVSLTVECWGGGGGGGPCGETSGAVGSGGGGGSGGYSRKTLPAALVRGGVLVTVGTGGYGGGFVANDWNAQPGGTTSFGAFCLANGGGGGGGNISSAEFWGNAGVGAAAGIGDLAAPGNPGGVGVSQNAPDTGVAVNVAGGMGGVPPGGGGAGLTNLTPVGNGNPGGDGQGPAAGGAGAVVNNPTGASGFVGGSGGDGLCVVTEYCWGDRDQPDVGWRPPLDVNVTMRPPKPPWPPGAWWPPGWPPGWGPGQPWPPGWGPQPREALEGREFEAGVDPYSQDPQDPEDP